MPSVKKVLLGGALALVGIGASAVAGVVVAMPAGVDGPGAMLAELQGHTRTTDHASAAQAPDGLVPHWTEDVGADVVIVRPGDASGDDSGSVRVDMTLPEGTTLPADCAPLPDVGMPWDGGGSWPALGSSAQLCDGWVTVVLDDHLYAWTADDLQAPARG